MNKCENPACDNMVTEYTVRNKLKMYCSSACRGKHNSIKSRNKARVTCINRLGVDNPSKSPTIRNKVRNTNLSKFGFSCPLKSPVIQEKIKKTNLSKFGVENPFSSDTIKNKIYDTNMIKFGFSCPLKSPVIQEKIKKTNLSKFGVENPFESSDVQKKIRNTMNAMYGVSYPLQSEIFRTKYKITSRLRYGTDNWNNMHISDDIKIKMNSIDWLISENCTKTLKQIGADLGINPLLISHRFAKYNIRVQYHTQSFFEKQVAEFVKSLCQNIISNDRIQIKPYELDIYLPELSIAIECNGRYFHQDQSREENKIKLCKEKGIKLYFVWDDMWYEDTHREKEKIRNILLQ